MADTNFRGVESGRISGVDRTDETVAVPIPAREIGDDYDARPLALPIDFSRLVDLFGDGSHLSGWLSIGGTLHHLELLTVRDDEFGVQVIGHPDFSETYACLQRMYPGRYDTILVPGREGQYIAHMFPGDITPI